MTPDRRKQRESSARKNVEQATQSEKWLAISCHVVNGRVHIQVNPCDWPVDNYQLVLDMLEDDFLKRHREFARSFTNNGGQ